MRKSAGAKVAAVCCALLVAVTACGGASRPSTDEIAKAIKSGESVMGSLPSSLPDDVMDDVVNCIATALYESEVSNEALVAFIEGDKEFEGSEGDQEAIDSVTSKLSECAKEAIGQ